MRSRHGRGRRSSAATAVLLAALIVCFPLPFGAMHAWALHLLRGILVLFVITWLANGSHKPALALAGWRETALILPPLLWLAAVLAYHHAEAVAHPAMGMAPLSRWLMASESGDALVFLVETSIAVPVVLAVLFAERAHVTLAVHALILSGTFQAVYGLISYFTHSSSIFGIPNRWTTDAAFGTFVNPDHFSGYLEMVLPVCVGYIVARARPLPESATLKERILAIGHDSFQKSILYLLAALLMALGIVFSKCRSGFIVLLASLLLLSLAGRGRATHGRRWVGALLALLCLVGAWIGFDPLYAKFARSATDSSLDARVQIWMDCVPIIRDHPWVGIGPGAFGVVSPAYERTDYGYRNEFAHNAYVQAAVDFGLPGAICWGFLAAISTYGLYRSWVVRHHPLASGLGAGCLVGIVAMYLHALTDFNLSIPANQATFVLLYCVGFAVVTKHDGRGNFEFRNSNFEISDLR